MNSDSQKDSPSTQVVDTLLKSPDGLIGLIREGQSLSGFFKKVFLICFLGLALFGFVLGNFSWGEQLWLAPAKMVLGVSLSVLVCLPGFYVYAALARSSMSLREGFRYLVAAMGIVIVLLVGFSPVLWVFARSSDSESFFGVLVLLTWLVSFGFGARFLFKALGGDDGMRKGPMRIWLGMFLLVSLQLSTSLRPLIGTSEKRFTTEKRSFLVHWGIEMSGIESAPEVKPTEAPVRKGPGVEGVNPYLKDE